MLLANVPAWGAFIRVCQLRHRDWGVAYAPMWCEIHRLLSLDGLWNPDIVEKLELCFAVQRGVEAEDAETRKALQDAAAAAGRGA